MNKIAKVALLNIVTRIRYLTSAGYGHDTEIIQTLTAMHDRILARWPNAYME